MTFSWSSCLPCEKLSRNASTPVVSRRWIISSLLLAGPSVARIFVRRIIASLSMRTPQPILTGPLFAPIHDELMALLRSLTAEEWMAPTVAGAWTVRDVAAHLLDTGLRRLSMHRDGYNPPLAQDA